ncbi:uncharacterized protein YaaN involved in tellurite resistance [Clostridium acetobutylicum]|nr:toxic anion resistance protein [Clostridium acetobutylicum]NOV87936.1 uncharacterized protein YaaN involved in tellurite resistance [Clostridium acetobutylicum]
MRFNFDTENEKTQNTYVDAAKLPENTDKEIEEKLKKIDDELKNSPEVIEISKNINVTDINSIMEFGSTPAEKISQFSDKILNTMKLESVENSSVLLKELTAVMNKFDKQELEEKPGGFFFKNI